MNDDPDGGEPGWDGPDCGESCIRTRTEEKETGYSLADFIVCGSY